MDAAPDTERLRAAAVAVGGAEVAGLDAEDALSAVLAARHASAAAFAVELEALARLAEVYPELEARSSFADRAVVFEVMAALGVSQRSAANRLSLAEGLAEVPALAGALRAGVLSAPVAAVVLGRVADLPAGLRGEAVARLLAAHAQVPGGLTQAQLGRLLGRIVAALDPDAAEQAQADAVRERRVWHLRGGRAGRESTLGMTGPAERVALCADTIDALAGAILDQARRARLDGDGPDGPDRTAASAVGVCPASATLEQARFDALDWLITGRAAASHPAWPPTSPSDEADADTGGAADNADTDGDTGPSAEAGEATGTGEYGESYAEAGDATDDGESADITESADESLGAANAGECVGRTQPSPGAASGRFAALGAGDDDGAGAVGQPEVFGQGPGPGGVPGCGCGRPRVSVVAQVTLSLATLLGLDDAPGELAGHGAIPASVARHLAASAEVWRRFLTDPVDGHLVTQAIKSYRPNAAMRAFLHARYHGTCASRGCTARVELEIDHNKAWPHGPTSVTNHAPLHHPHHEGKTCGAWCHELHPDTGALTQTSPLGRSYTTRPLPPLCGRLDGGPPDPAVRRAQRARRSSLRRRLRGIDTLFPDLPGGGTSPLEHHLATLLRADA